MKLYELITGFFPSISDKMISESTKLIEKNVKKWDKPFFTDTKSYINMDEIKEATKEYMDESIKNIIVLGTGGSIQSLLALKHLSRKKIHPITSSRVVELKKCLNHTNPEDSVVIPISRGGETLDVNSTIGTFIKREYPIIGLSTRGKLHDILKKNGSPILDVPDLSGRFAGSISNVAIVPAYIAGINTEEFLNGLKEGYDNPDFALRFATFIYNMYLKGYKIAFSMPYSKSLEGCVGLFVQEISESTGKDNKGIIGAYQPAPLCQHSVLEYLLGGTKGIVFPILWTLINEMDDLILDSSIPEIDGISAQYVVNHQADATLQALIEQKVPTVSIRIESPDEHNIGLLISYIQNTIYYLCVLLDVNWANNPKVNIGKKICNEAIKRKLKPHERATIQKEKAKIAFKTFF